MTNFNNYDNNIEVLNEGFFDFVKKWTARILHSLFKANDFESLFNRLTTLEETIKYGKNKSNKSNESINEGNRSRRTRYILEDGENSETETKTSTEPSKIDSDIDKQQNTEVDLNNPKQQVVNMENIDMNTPSFPQVAKQLLNGLKKQLEEKQKLMPISGLENDITAVKSGRPLSQRYINMLEVVVTDFLRKYSSGTLTLPRPERNQTLSYDQLMQWQKYAKDPGGNSEKMFAYVHDTMEKIVNDYEKEFKNKFEVLKTSEDSFIQKYKNNEKNKNDLMFISDWETKIMQKVENLKTSCIEFIPTAISNYFISSDIYKNATDYVLLCLELLAVNSKNIAQRNEGKGNSLLNYMNEWLEGDKEDIIDVVNQKRDEILSHIQNNDEYSDLLKELNSINDNTIENAIQNIQNIKGIQKIDDRRLGLISNDIINKATSNNNTQSIIIAILINHINSNYKYKFNNINDIFNLNINKENN